MRKKGRGIRTRTTMTVVMSLAAFVIGISIAFIFQYLKDQQFLQPPKSDGPKLAIGILSAQENFEARQAIRDTWLKGQHNNDSFRGWFIIGNRGCDIHPENRVDQYGCQRWEPRIPESSSANLVEAFYTNKGQRLNKVDGPFSRQWISEIYFKVMCHLRLKRLGLLTDLLENTTVPVRLVFTDRRSQETVAEASFSNSDPGIKEGLFTYQPVRDFEIEKGFEGLLSLEEGKVFIDTLTDKAIETQWEGVSNTVILQSPGKAGSSVNVMFVVSFTAAILSPDHLKLVSRGQSARDEEWREQQTTVGRRLTTEIEEFQDIILVETIDIYRNVIHKLMLFHKWINDEWNVDYVLKTDDDCFINVNAILHELKNHNKNMKRFWWGSFRYQWLVQPSGKWMELDYSADVYPAFACGSGNIVSKSVSQWLSQNTPYLSPYQGEDVSMGIYLAAISPSIIDDSRWRCTKSCRHDMLSMPNLSPKDMTLAWNSLIKCYSPCGCH